LSAETIAAAAYAAFLVVCALGLDALGRHTHERSGRFRTQGFSYDAGLDLWVCPEGEQLRPFAIDHRRRVARYRARPMICNACPAKDGCTDSDQGREIARPLDPWPHSEAGRFHRGISVVLLGLASVIALAGILLTPSLPDLILLGSTLTVSALVGLRMSRAFAAMPSGFPDDPDSTQGKALTARGSGASP
jgi:hypothetical protein